jgi:hypothetical protein
MEEYVVSAWVLGDDFLFLNWFNRAGWTVSMRTAFVANQVASPVMMSINLALCTSGGDAAKWAWFVNVFVMNSISMFANGAFHYGCQIAHQEFSPGVLSGVALYMPWAAYCNYIASAEFGHPPWLLYPLFLLCHVWHMRDFGTIFTRNPNLHACLVRKAGSYTALVPHPEAPDTQFKKE